MTGSDNSERANRIDLDGQDAAAMFRSVAKNIMGCQHEQGAMRWWTQNGMLVTLDESGWWLSIPRRGRP